MSNLHSTELDGINSRLGHIENVILEHSQTLATVLGKQESAAASMAYVVETLRQSQKTGTKGDILQKVLIGAIIVQSVMSGLLTPDNAKSILHGLLGGLQ